MSKIELKTVNAPSPAVSISGTTVLHREATRHGVEVMIGSTGAGGAVVRLSDLNFEIKIFGDAAEQLKAQWQAIERASPVNPMCPKHHREFLRAYASKNGKFAKHCRDVLSAAIAREPGAIERAIDNAFQQGVEAGKVAKARELRKVLGF